MQNLVDPDPKLPSSDAVELGPVGVESALHPQSLQDPFQYRTVVELESRYLDRASSLLAPREPRLPRTRTQALLKLPGIGTLRGQDDKHDRVTFVGKNYRL